MDRPPITITVFDKSYARKGVVGALQDVTGSIRANAPGDFTFTVDADHQRVVDLASSGARCVIEYQFDQADASQVLMSGPVSEITGKGQTAQAVRTFSVSDDWAEIFNTVLGTRGVVTGAVDYARYSGNAETVTRQLVSENASDQGVPITLQTNLNRGTALAISLRMHSLGERLFPAAASAGLMVRVLQLGATRTLVISVPETHTRVLTQESGVIVDGDFQIAPPITTRVWVAAGGEGVDRVMRSYINTALETEYGLRRAAFVDARDVEATDPALEATLQARADEAFVAGAAKVGLSVTLTETPTFRFGRTFNLGDQVSVQLAGSPVLTDFVREVQFGWSTSAGLEITPLVGDWSESVSDQVMRAVAANAKGVRDLQRSK